MIGILWGLGATVTTELLDLYPMLKEAMGDQEPIKTAKHKTKT